MTSDNTLAVLGSGRGLATVLRALSGEDALMTVIVSIAYEQAREGDRPQDRDSGNDLDGASVEDLRRSLEALTGEPGALLRAIRRPLTIERVGSHPLGNLVIASVAAAFDDYGQASIWLGEQLEIDGAVLPATIEPVRRDLEMSQQASEVPSTAGFRREPHRLRFAGDRLNSPDAAIRAIGRARLTLLAPGALYASVLSTAAVPDLAAALGATPGQVIWIANLAPDPGEAAGMTGLDHLLALRLNGVRVDAVLYDPSAELQFDPTELANIGVQPMPQPLRSSTNPRRHDPELLRLALRGLSGSRPKASARS